MSRINDIWLRKPAGLVLGLDFSGGRVSSPTGHTGTLAGNATVAAGTRFLALDGTGDWLYFGTATEFNMTGDMTVSLWAKRNGNPAAIEVIAAKYAAAAGWLIFLSTDGKVHFDGRTSGGSYATGPVSTASICNSAWRHVCAVRSGTSWNLCVDGAAVTPVANGSHTFANSQPLSFGADDAGAGFVNPMTGSLTGIGFYNRALTQPEIAQIYNAGAARIAQGGTP